MENILSLAIVSKTNYVFIDKAIDTALYMFDEEGKYIETSSEGIFLSAIIV